MNRISAIVLFFISSQSYLFAGDSISHQLEGEVFFGPALGETATGLIAYPSSATTGTGEEFVDVFDGLTVQLNFLGQAFTESDDTDFGNFPVLRLQDGVPTFLDYVVIDGDGVGQEITDPRVDGFFLTDLVANNGGFFTEIVTVPEPAAVTLLCLLCSYLGLVRRR